MKGASLSVCLHDTRKARSEKKPFSPPPLHSTRKQRSVDKHRSANNILANTTAEGLAPLCSAKRPLKTLADKPVGSNCVFVTEAVSLWLYVHTQITNQKHSQKAQILKVSSDSNSIQIRDLNLNDHDIPL